MNSEVASRPRVLAELAGLPIMGPVIVDMDMVDGRSIVLVDINALSLDRVWCQIL